MAERVTVQVDAIGNFSNIIGEVGKFRSQLQSLKLPDKLTAKLEKGFDNVESKVAHFQSLLSKGITTKGDFSKLVSSARTAETAINGLKDDIRSIGDKDIQIAVANSADIQKAEQELQKILNMEQQLSSFGTSKGKGSFAAAEVESMQKLANTSEGLRKRFKEVTDSIKSGNIEQADAAIQKLIAHAQKYQAIAEKNGKDTSKWDSTIKWAQGAQSQIDGLINKATQARNTFEQIRFDKFSQMKGSIDGVANGFTKAATAAKQFMNAEVDAASHTARINEQVGHLRTQANYFFGLQNMGRLVARGIREAAESVRDLDKAMTETAVVTEKSVGDLWNDLPKYTKLANKLGATTQGAYETMTLYFQQGLNDQETFEIGEETMKMARIAGLDYAQTTNMMTAALRGFNMELNQTSAKRVNDVYSELAAITASDTRELGLAMERTASIAHSANMDFGNTTAFLAQMIETTREAPENLGTAMKTIIARFQELKQNPYEVSEVEGEEVDFNRVDKALKSIGVDLMDNRDKFRDLDDVFMDISSRWDGLSQTQQRYIATIAAGSRQQSRFLAMVQNYDRLKELTDAAANSEGAATVQFNKTLDSYEAKVNKLKNAWQAFTMSLANNKAVKSGVDILQKIITFGNKIIETFGKAGKAIGGDFGKGLAEMVAAFGLGAAGFKGLQFGANTGLGMLAKMTTGSKAGGRFFMGGGTERAESGMVTAKITNPIVNAVNRVTAAIQKKPFKDANYQDTKARSDLLRDRRNALYNKIRTKDETNTGMRIGNQYGDQQYFSPYKAFNASDVKKQMAGLTAAEQEAIYKSSPILQKALQRGYSKAYSKLNLGPDGEKALNKHWKEMSQKISSGQISTQEALRQLYNPDKVAQDIGGETGKKITEAINNRIKTWKPADKEALEKKLMTQAEKRFGVGDETRQERRQWVNQQVKFKAGQELGIGRENTAQITKAEGAITKLSSSASSAGQSVMGLGMALSSAGFTGAGSILMTVGNGIMGIGMAAEGASIAVGALSKAFNAIGVTSIASAFTNPILLGIAALGGLVATGITVAKKHESNLKKIRKDSKKVLKDYEDDITDTTRNINKLTDSKDTYAQLSQGVDKNNNNVSLGTAEYADYLQIINDIAKMHPEMVKGYNAQGQAILKETDAVNKAIQAEKDRQHAAEEAFASEDSLNKLIAGRNTTKRWQVGQDGPKSTNGYIDTTKQSQLKTDSQAVIDSIQELKGGDKLLSNLANQFGIQVSDFTNLTDAGLKVIQDHGAAFLEQAQNEFKNTTDKNTKDILSNLQNSIAQVGKDTEGIEAVTEPIYKSLSTFASQERLFDNVPDEFKDAAERGLKEISKLSIDEFGNQITGEAMQRMARDLGNSLSDLGGHADQYQKILDDVSQAQDEYVQNLNKDDYLNDSRIQAAVSNLQQWADEARAKGDETSLILAETFENQLASIQNFTNEGAAILSEGFNTFGNIIAAANGAFEDFQKQIEGGDFYTGSDAFKQVFDEIQDGIDNAGKGSQTWWKGAAKLLGDQNKNIQEGNFKEAEAQVKALESMFAEGQQGADAFFDHVSTKQQETLDPKLFGDNIQQVSDLFKVAAGEVDIKLNDLSGEQFADLADKLGMSDQMLAAMLNKAKQFYDIDFSNVDVLREALATSESTVTGIGKTGKNTDLYTKESTFRAEAEAQNYTPTEIKDLKDTLTEKGVKLVKDAKDIDQEDMKSYIDGMGIKTGEQFVDTFSKLGFSRDELQSLYKDYGNLEGMQSENGQTFSQMYSDYLKAQETANLEPDAKAANELETTNSILTGILAAVGGISLDSGQKELENVVGKKGENDTAAQRFGEGLNASGNKFANEQEYNASKKALESEMTNNQRIIDGLIARKNELHGSEKKAIEDEITAYQQANQVIAANLEEGEKKYEQLQKEKQAQEEKNKAKEDEKTKTTEDSTQADKALETKENLQKVKEAQDALKTNGFNIGQAFGLEDGQISQAALQFSNIINTLKQSGVEVENLGSALQNLGPGGLEQLNDIQLGQLISQLNLTQEQADAINALNPNLQVTATADTSEADAAVQEVEAETAQPKILKVVAEATGNVKQVAQQAANQAKQQPQQQTQIKNDITLQSNVVNPEEPKQKIDEVVPKDYKATVNASITMNSTVNSGNTQQQLQQAADKNSKGIKSNVKTGGTQVVRVTADTSAAQAKINALINKFNKTYTLKYKASGPSSIKVPISANFTGSWQKTVRINKSDAKGQNNYIAYRAPIHANSLASGTAKKNQTKKFNGGLTLTGEKGFEVAWLPSENRSMILGAQGPQMVNLPRDAVVWTNEQSKKIMKQKAIPANSFATGYTSSGSFSYGSSNKGSSTAKTITSTAKHVKKNSDKSAKAVTDAAKAAGYVSVWWENIARKTEVTQRKMDTSAKAFEKYLKEMSATLKKTGQSLASGGGGGNDYISNITKFMSYNQAQINKATAELKQLDKGTTAQQKGKKNANKAAYNSGAASAVQISYSYKAGKKKKKSKTKNEIVNTAGYIKAENGTYVIDQAKLNQVKNVEKRKALKEALDKEINDRLSKKYAAEDNIQKAQEALEKMGEELYKTFFAWENELTKIYNLTKLIESSEGRVSRIKEYQETLNKQLSTGLQKATENFREQDLNAFQAKITQTKDKINNQVELIKQQKEAVTNAINVSDEQTILNSINKKLQDATAANNKVSNAKDKYDKALAKANNLKSQKSKAQQDIKNANKEIADLKKQKKKAKSSKKKKKIQKQIDAAEKKKAKAESVLKTIDPKIKNAQKEADAAKKAYEQIKKSTSGQLSATEKLGYENYAKNLQDKIDAQLAAQKYLTISRSADGTLQVKFDTDKFETDKQAGLLNEERGKAIQDYVKELVETSEELNKAYQDLNATINELYDDLSQLQDDWTGYANDLWDISEKEVKSQTDNFKKLSDSINNALKKLLDEVKNKLDERRKQEDNAKTERDIAQKQQRLAALRADTSGGHQVEIAQLEKEIADAQQDYQRSLEDQLLDRLQQQADLASQQREHQIALQEAILDGVNNAALVNKWMDNPAAYRNEIYEAYKTANEYDKRPDVLKEDLDRKFEVLMEGLLTNQEKQRELIEAINETKQASDIIENSINDMSNAETVKPATVSTSSSSNSSTTPSSTTTTSAAKTPQKSTTTKTNNSKQTAYTNYLKSVKKLKPGSVKSSHINKLFTLGAAAGKGKATVLTDLLTKVGGSDPFSWKNIFKAIIDADGINRYNLVKTWPNGTGTLADALKTLKTNPNTLKEIKKHKNYKNAKALKFKTGGLADYTGPAWLDGTPSKPELVLDATDTKNFLALKDVLSKAIHNSNSVSNSYGDAAYEININVDHLNSDYDVDRVAERVKKIIIKDAGYRNVTQVRNFR